MRSWGTELFQTMDTACQGVWKSLQPLGIIFLMSYWWFSPFYGANAVADCHGGQETTFD